MSGESSPLNTWTPKKVNEITLICCGLHNFRISKENPNIRKEIRDAGNAVQEFETFMSQMSQISTYNDHYDENEAPSELPINAISLDQFRQRIVNGCNQRPQPQEHEYARF